MSIWRTWAPIGTDEIYEAHRGVVLSYAEGFSNHYPDLTGEAERPAGIGVADLAPWCVPGHDECGDCDDESGSWLRLEVAAPETLDFWRKDDDGNPTVEAAGACVVLDRAAVEALRDDLTEWLGRKVP